MELKDSKLMEFKSFEQNNKDELLIFKSKLDKMTKRLKDSLETFFKQYKKFRDLGYEPKTTHEFYEYFDYIFLLPLEHKSKCFDLIIESSWLSIIKPQKINPIIEFDKFYQVILKFLFIQDSFSNLQIEKDVLINELEELYFHLFIYNTKKHNFERTFSQVNETTVSNNRLDPFIETAISLIKEGIIKCNLDLDDTIMKVMAFDDLRTTLIEDSDGINSNFKEPVQASKYFYKKLHDEKLIKITYSEFKTFLAFDESKLDGLYIPVKIKVSAEETQIKIDEIGGFFFEFQDLYFKGNQKAFRIWVQDNFEWFTTTGKLVSMSNSNLNKYLKKYYP